MGASAVSIAGYQPGECLLHTNADDRLALDSLCRVERGDGVVEGRDVADVRPQPTIPDPLHDLTQVGAIGLDDEVDQLVRAEVARRMPISGASGADDIGAGLTGELRHHRSDSTGRTVHEHALAGLDAAMYEQPLPRGQPRDRQARADREVDVARQRREV